MAVKRILFLFFLLSFSVYSFGQQNNTADTVVYTLTSDSSNYDNDSNYSMLTIGRIKFPIKYLFTADFNFDSISPNINNLKLSFLYRTDSTCRVVDLKVKDKSQKGINYEYAERKMLRALNVIPHKVLLNGKQQTNCSLISNTYVTLKIF